MADLISRAALLDAFREYMVENCDRERCALEENCKTCERGCLWRKVVIEAPAVDAVEVDFIAKWLAEIAMNNFGYPVEDMAAACVEIIKRLDGLRKFAEERREEQ